MEDNQKKLSAIVDQWLIDNDLTTHWFNKYLSQAIWALKEINLDVTGKTRKCILDVTPTRTVILPGDYEDFVIVGIPRGQYFIPLAVNAALRGDKRLADRNDVISGLISQHLPNGIDINDYAGTYFFNYDGGNSFGGSGMLPSKGYFRIDKDDPTCKKILLDYDYCSSQVYLEYMTDGFDPCGETVVEVYLHDYLIKHMEDFYERKNNPKASEASKYRTGQMLFFAKKIVRARANDLTPSTMLAVNREFIRLTPKL
jgi:hypothetical protein